jgi:hypothetical protein
MPSQYEVPPPLLKQLAEFGGTAVENAVNEPAPSAQR